MKNLLLVIILFSFIFNQEPCDGHCLSDETVKGLRTTILEFETSDSLNAAIITELESTISLYKQYQLNDSLTINLYEQKIDLLDSRLDLYKDLVKEVKPKWYENKWIWFTFGVFATAGSVKLAGEIID